MASAFSISKKCLVSDNKMHYFSSLWETCQTLFWAIFGLIDLDNFELTGIKEFTRFFGLLMFGSFSVINIIVLLNLLIAMMNHSYQLISVSSVRSFLTIYVRHLQECRSWALIIVLQFIQMLYPYEKSYFFFFTGKSRYRVEVCQEQIMDILLRRWWHCPTSFQHHSNSQKSLLWAEMGLFKALWKVVQNKKGASQNGI